MPLGIDDLKVEVRNLASTIDINSSLQTREHVPYHPPTLHHYTGVDGFMGIVKTGRIWATNTKYLNDSHELIHAQKLADQIIAERITESRSVLVTIFLKYLARYLYDYDIVDNYVASFCAEPDLLSQWRGYGRDLGYAIGLEPDDRLSKMPVAEHSRIVNVIYGHDQQRKIIGRRIDLYISPVAGIGCCDQWFDEASLREIDQIIPGEHYLTDYRGPNPCVREALKLINRLGLCLRDELHGEFIRMKHAGFAEEREWRIVYTDLSNELPVYFRTANGYLVPYVVLPLLPAEPSFAPAGFKLKSVMCGPCHDPNAAIHSTKMWLHSSNYHVYSSGGIDIKDYSPDGIEVKGSSTPYRTW